MTTTTHLPHIPEPPMISIFDARAEALFASRHDPSEHMSAAQVAAAIAEAVRHLGVRGCACSVAFEFGDHPDVAAQRMAWAIATVAASFPKRGRR